MKKAFMIAIGLASIPWAASASNPDFGVLPLRYFGGTDATYGCNSDGTCRVPSPEQLETVIQALSADAPKRLSMLQGVIERYESIEATLKAISSEASAQGKARTAGYYGEVGTLVVRALEAKLGRVMSHADTTLGSVSEFLGTQSSFLRELRGLKEILIGWNDRINNERDEPIRDAFRMKMEKEYFSLTQGTSPIARGLWQMNRMAEFLATESEELIALKWCEKECNQVLDITRFLEFKNCDARKRLLDWAHAPFEVKFVKELYRDSLLVIEDSELITKLLDGSDGKSLAVQCKKVFPRPVKAKYDEKTHTLSYPWFRGFDVCPPGSCGDLSFHFSRPLVTPREKKVIDLLKEKLTE